MNADALILCGSADEAERLALRGLDALDGSVPRENEFYQKYRERQVILTPVAHETAFGAAVTLFALCKCRVETMTNGADLDAADLLALPRAPMFTEAKAAEKFVRHDEPEAIAEPFTRSPLVWRDLSGKTPPPRVWAIDHWLGMGHVTLLAGRGGIGKSLLAQVIGSALALGKPYIDNVTAPRTVLMWAAEDDRDELWRRQVAIAQWFGVEIDTFDGKLIVESYADRDCTLMCPIYGRLMRAPMVEELAAQVIDYKADFVMLDNIARLFGGNENDRHQVTQFVAMFTSTLTPRGAGGLLLGHTGKPKDSEFSGSTSWENAVRSRLWLSDHLPDQDPEKDGGEFIEPVSDLRYLSRRKANYSARDLRTLHYSDGVFVCDVQEAINGAGIIGAITRHRDETIVREAFAKLIALGKQPTDSSNSPDYLPRLILEFKLAEGRSKRDLAAAMRKLMLDGALVRGVVGRYQNRSPRTGLVLKPEAGEEPDCTK